MFLVNLPPDLLREHRIADFGGNVYILYVPELAPNSGVLLLLLSEERPKNLRLPDVTCNKTEFDLIIDYGK